METLFMPNAGTQSEIEQLQARLAEVESRLAEAQELIHAIQSGEVDAVVVSGPEGEQVFTLKGAEYAYRALVEAMNEGAATLGADGTVLYCNQHLSTILDLPIEQIIGHQAAPLFGDEADNFYKLFVNALCGDYAKAAIDLHTGEGVHLPVQVSLRAMKTDDSAAICMVVTDLTEARTSEALHASEKLFRTFANSIPQLCWMAEPDGSIFWFNERWYRFTGSTPEQMAGWGWQSVHAPEVLPHVLKGWRSSIATGKPFEMVVPLRGADGVFHPFLTLVLPVLDSEGKVVRWFGTNTDITESKQIENALRDSEAKFRSLFENSLDAVFLTVPDGQVLAANPAACKMFGMSEAELCRVGWKGVTDPEESRLAIAAEERMHAGRLVKTELNFIRSNGEKFPCEVDSVILPGDPPRSFVILRDITERRRITRALIESEKLASVGRLASTIAHEINNPLEAVGNALYLAIISPDTPPLVKSYLDMASEELERVTHVTRQTLEFHQSNNTAMSIDLRENLDGVLNLYQGRLRTRDIAIERRYSTVQPIHGVNSEIRQIITNLLSNSLDALANDGKLTCRITRSVGRGGLPVVRLTIADNGSGIDPKNRKKIFEPFFTTKEFVGTGLGLWIIKQIVEKHGATIRVRSKLQKGTVFSIAFPIPDSNEESKSGSAT